jgi:hypothetical protein
MAKVYVVAGKLGDVKKDVELACAICKRICVVPNKTDAICCDRCVTNLARAGRAIFMRADYPSP